MSRRASVRRGLVLCVALFVFHITCIGAQEHASRTKAHVTALASTPRKAGQPDRLANAARPNTSSRNCGASVHRRCPGCTIIGCRSSSRRCARRRVVHKRHFGSGRPHSARSNRATISRPCRFPLTQRSPRRSFSRVTASSSRNQGFSYDSYQGSTSKTRSSSCSATSRRTRTRNPRDPSPLFRSSLQGEAARQRGAPGA